MLPRPFAWLTCAQTQPPPNFLQDLSPEEQQLIRDDASGDPELHDESPSSSRHQRGAGNRRSSGTSQDDDTSPVFSHGSRHSTSFTSPSPRSAGGGGGHSSNNNSPSAFFSPTTANAMSSPASGGAPLPPLKPGKGAWIAPSAIGNLGMSRETKIVGKAKGILNKLTKLTFDKLSDELLVLINKVGLAMMSMCVLF